MREVQVQYQTYPEMQMRRLTEGGSKLTTLITEHYLHAHSTISSLDSQFQPMRKCRFGMGLGIRMPGFSDFTPKYYSAQPRESKAAPNGRATLQ
jgi:hypothetical protein